MRIGLSTPVVVSLPGAASKWETTAGIDEIARVAQAADKLGFEYLTCSEHTAVPVADAASRGSTYWDPLATFGFLAARTSSIRLATSVLVLGYHHPLEIAKRYGTLDRICGGRLVLGVGVGSLAAEFDLLEADWPARGDRADDAIRALRASLSNRQPSYRGTYFQYEQVVVDPCAVQLRVPIWVGGRTARSLRRAVSLADGWMPFGVKAFEVSRLLSAVHLPDGFDIVLAPRGPLDPLGNPEETVLQVQALQDAGATAVTCSIRAESVDHFCDQLARLRELTDNL